MKLVASYAVESVEAALAHKFYAMAMFDKTTVRKLAQWRFASNVSLVKPESMHITLCKSDTFFKTKLGDYVSEEERVLYLGNPISCEIVPKWVSNEKFAYFNIKPSKLDSYATTLMKKLQDEGLRKPLMDSNLHLTLLNHPIRRFDTTKAPNFTCPDFPLVIDRVQLLMFKG